MEEGREPNYRKLRRNSAVPNGVTSQMEAPYNTLNISSVLPYYTECPRRTFWEVIVSVILSE
jgi:hypothetical protein